MTPIVQTVTRLVSGLMFVFGVYVVAHGHLTPGGGFAGGVVIAGAFILRVLALGRKEPGTERASHAEAFGILVFWFLGILGLLTGTAFFVNVLSRGEAFQLLSAGFIPFANLGIGIEVAAALVCIFLALLLVDGREDAE